MAACKRDIHEVERRLRHVHAAMRRTRRREAAGARYACSRETMQDALHRRAALSFLQLQQHDASDAVRFLLAEPAATVDVHPCVSKKVHEWEEECVAVGGEDPLQPASRLCVQALKTARAFRRERQLFAWVRHQNEEKGLAPSNTALWREHVTARVPADTDAAAPGAHARTLRSRNQWIARWSRRWNVRRGFFKAGERLPLETRRAAFALPFGTPAEKRGPENRPKNRPA
jgi:hypothetical protein